jgi:hypothetical protein
VEGREDTDMTIDIFTDIAKRMEPDKLETLARFRAAAKTHTWLPTKGDWNILPHGFLANRIQDGEVVAQLNPFGMRVAMAAEKLAKEAEEAA